MCHLGNIGILESSLCLSREETISDVPEWNTFSFLFFFVYG